MPTLPPSDAFLASLVNSSRDAIISKNLEGVITSWNRGAERIFGYTAAEAIGCSITLIFPPDRIDEEPGILARIVAGEQIEHYETVRRRKDGGLVDISLTVSPIYDQDDRIIGASKVARDVTQQRRDQERLAVTLASIGDGVISTDEHGRVVFMNAVAERLTGWTLGDAAGHPLITVFRIINESTRQTVESPVDRVLSTGCVVGLANHTILLARDGVERPIDDSAAPIRNRAGELIGVVLVFRDVTERREAELAALRLAAIVEGSDDAIVSKDLSGIVRSWNPGAERIFGYTEEEMIGTPITILLPPDRLSEEQDILARLQRGEHVDHFETKRRRKDGRLIDVSLTISPICSDGGHVIGASKIARDITELKLARERLKNYTVTLETQVRERTAKLEAMVFELEAFSYSLSHDMRAPLRAIHGFTDIVLSDHADKIGESAEYLRRVINASNRMDRLIKDVLSFARLSREEIQLGALDLDALVHDIIEERPELCPPRAEVVVKGPLAPVVGHDAFLTQCLTNLLGNAVKFVAPGVQPKVEVFTQERDGRVRIHVRDNGIGIREEGQTKLFALFHRLHTADEFEGTGVGLAIVRKAAERMDGKAGVNSAEGQGSTFWVELPAVRRR